MSEDAKMQQAVRDGIMRGLAAIGLCGLALIHLLDVQGKLEETPYIGWMYIGLIVAAVVLAGALVVTSDGRAWLGAAALPALVIVGYALSRTTGLPQASQDIGNWTEPLGLASLFVEGALVALSSAVLLSRHIVRAPVSGMSSQAGIGRLRAEGS